MKHVSINRITPIGTAVTEVLYLLFQQDGTARGTTQVTEHAQTTMRITRFKMLLNGQPGGKTFGGRNAWVCETNEKVFTLYLTHYEETLELYKHNQSFEVGLKEMTGFQYGLAELYRACIDIRDFLMEGVLPERQTPDTSADAAHIT